MSWEEARRLGPYQQLVLREILRAHKIREMVDDLRVQATAQHGKAAGELLNDLHRDIERLMNRIVSPETLMQDAIRAAAPLYANFKKPETAGKKKNPFRFAIGKQRG